MTHPNVINVTDDREEDGSITVMVNFPERMYHVKFIQFDTNEYVPVGITPETTDEVHVEDIFNGLIAAPADHINRELGVGVPFNQPGFAPWVAE